MSYEASEPERWYFDEPRLKMTVAGRFTVRVVSYISYLVLVFAMGTFLISEIKPLVYVGWFLALFFIDRLLHWNQADMPLAELPEKGKVNLARVTSPATFTILGRAFDRGIVAKQNFYLAVADRMIGLPQTEEGLERLDVKPAEFKAKLEEFLAKKDGAAAMASRETYLAAADMLMREAFEEAIMA